MRDLPEEVRMSERFARPVVRSRGGWWGAARKVESVVVIGHPK